MSWASDRQRRFWSSAPTGEIEQLGLALEHPNFTNPWYLTTWPEAFQGELRGELVTYQPHPFEFERPQMGGDGKYEMRLSIYNSGKLFANEVKAAYLTGTGDVQCSLNSYFPGDPTPQTQTLVLQLPEPDMNEQALTGRATSIDFLNLGYPRQIYNARRHPGLLR